LDDIREIKAAIKVNKIIILGSNFNSMEVSRMLYKGNKKLEIVVIDKLLRLRKRDSRYIEIIKPKELYFNLHY